MIIRPNLFKLSMVVLQIAIIRPIILFLAAVLYMDRTYITGNVRIYIVIESFSS